MVLKPLDFLLAFLLLAGSLLAGNSLLLPDVCGVSHDDAIYAITAKSLAQGEGYKLINLPGSPIQTKYPILYPAMLSLVWKLCPNFPANLLSMKWLTLTTGALAISLSYLYLVRFQYAIRTMAFCGALLCVCSSWFWYCATLTQTEAPFALLVILSLWCLEKPVRQEKNSTRNDILAGIVLSLPLMCRLPGISILLAAGWLLFRQKRRLIMTMLGAALAVSPWVFSLAMSFGAFKNNPVHGYYTDYLGWWSQSGYFLMVIFFSNLFVILLQSTSLVFSGLHHLFITVLDKWYLIAGTLVGFIPWWYLGLSSWKAKSPKPLPIFMAVYVLMLCVCPWPPGRYLVPLLPLLAALMMSGLYTLIDKSLRDKAIWLCLFIAIAAFVFNFADIQEKSALDKQLGYPSIPFDRQQTAKWSSYGDLFNWLRQNASQDSIIGSQFDTMVYLYTGRKCIRPYPIKAVSLYYGGTEPPIGTAEELVSNLNQLQVDYLVSMPIPGFVEEQPFFALVTQIRKDQPNFLKPVYVGIDSRFAIYQCNRTN